MKKFLCIFLSILGGIVATARAQQRAEGIAELLGWSPGDTAIIVPSSARQLPAFALASLPGLRSVSFAPGSRCRIIGDFAFAGCDSLRSVVLPASVISIGEGAFRECGSLRYVNIPPAVRVIPKECFLRCGSLDSIAIPEAVVEIKGHAFAQCSSLRSIAFPPRLIEIGNNAFALCSSLTEVGVPPLLEILESYAFSGCSRLKSATLPGQPHILGELIFEDCPSLLEIMEPSMAPPPIECDSRLASPDDTDFYRRVALRVPPAALDLYRRNRAFSLFRNIQPLGLR